MPWNNYTGLGSVRTYLGPVAVCWGPNRIDVFVKAAGFLGNGSEAAPIWHKFWDGARWTAFRELGRKAVLGASVAS